MKILCGRCLQGGKTREDALIGEKEPREDETETRGLCPEHWRQTEEEILNFKAFDALRRL